MKDICSKIQIFYKIAKIDLAFILAGALKMGDKDMYMVFLDALEEQSPRFKKIINTKSFKATLANLAKQFPEVIKLTHYGVRFATSVFSNILEIGWQGSKIWFVMYDEFYWEEFRIIFTEPIDIDGQEVKTFWNSSRGLQLINGHNHWPPSSEKPAKLFEGITQKVKNDIRLLENLIK